jgi:DHA1 family bicyclomycin/chloramphenicol resistance-like MFS transporter
LGERALILLLSAIVAIGSVATNIYIPALPAVRDHFDASVSEVQATFSVALLTFAVGMLFWGPFADRYGRRCALFTGLGLTAAGSLLCGLADSLGALILGRAVLAFGTATALIVARTVVSDLFPEHMARSLAQLTVVAVFAGASSPIVGGFLTVWLGWRSVFGALILTCATVGWLAFRYLPETRLVTVTPPRAGEMVRVAGALLAKPLYLSCMLQSSAAFATFVVFITLAPYVMVSALGRPPTEYGLYYPLVSIGYVLGNWALGRWSAVDHERLIRFGVVVQLVAAVVALGFVAAGLRHPLWIFLPMGMLFFGQGLVMPHLTAIAVSLAPPHATGVGTSTLGFLNQFASAACVQAMGLAGDDSALPMLMFVAGAAAFQLVVLRLSPPMQAAARAG